MKKIFLSLFVFSLLGCEKDDICSDETTPRLIIEFFNIAQPANNLNVTNLKVVGVGMTDELDTFTAVSKIEVPLKITDDVTRYSLTLNSTNDAIKNEDILEFNYIRNQVFVSRACGYKTTFELNPANGVVHSSETIPNTQWIKNIFVETNSITTENETHIKIYF
ncbi:MAG: DUF6452 family protein [Flavobacterium sp.]|jgi:hypothetical protein|uniref:DUF6452 family protein n=1 Tax=Flavobacterium sp. TaxID=239 RepID=UPI0022BDF09E|nr:DUF6452 family protein [Flavobacterium sp.]MCZ8331309.1 DUF6452 family protein [Flavobacterium sp.]